MITIGKSIYSILSNDSEVNSLVGNRIYPLILPENTALPCVVYERTFLNSYTKDYRVFSDNTVSLTILSEDYATSIDIAGAVDNALKNYQDAIIKSVKQTGGSEVYVEGAYIQKLDFEIRAASN